MLTSIWDPVYGDPIDGGEPAQAADTALCLYGVTTSQTLQGLTVRYAMLALGFYDGGTCGSAAYSVNNCSLFNCAYGIRADWQTTVSINNSTCCEVSTPVINLGACSVQGALSAMNPPAITNLPLCQFVLPNNSVNFTSAASPPSLTYTWSLDSSPTKVYVVGTNTSATIYPAQLGTNYGGQQVHFYATAPYGSGEAAAWVGIVDSSALAVATHWITYTNGEDCTLWDQRDTNNYPPTLPTLKWHTNSLLYGKIGFTAISQRDDWNWAYPGQLPVTALTRRHGYMRGHGTVGTTNNVPFAGYNTNYNGQNVYFCTSNNTVVTATVTNAYTRCWGTDGYDWTILIFSADLPSSIQPMEVSYTNPVSFSVVFNTEQGGYMSANNPPFPNPSPQSNPSYSADTNAFRPFNLVTTFKGGDSGSPIMVPWTDDYLVFLGGDTTSAPGYQMQVDMNNLCTSVRIEGEDYQMTVHSVQ